MIIINYFHRFFAQLDSIAFGVKNRCTNRDRERWMCRLGKVFSKNPLKNFRQYLIVVFKKFIVALLDFLQFFPIGNVDWRSWSSNLRKIVFAKKSKKGLLTFATKVSRADRNCFIILKKENFWKFNKFTKISKIYKY